MKSLLKLAAMACAAMLATGTAYAQAPGSGAPPSAGYTAQNPTVANAGDETERDAERARREAVDAARIRDRAGPRTPRSVPAKPEQVIAGAEVRDPKGVVVGKIDAVSVGSAVIATELGKVEVPLEAFGMNNKGLLIPMSKADFDKAVAEANKGS